MKRIILVFVAALFFSAPAKSQKLLYGVKAGLGLTNFQFTGFDVFSNAGDDIVYAGLWYDRKFRVQTSYYAGGVVELDLKKKVWFLSSGLLANLKLAHVTAYDSEGGFDENFHANLLYLQLPLNINYRFGHFLFGGGAYAGLAVAGKAKFEETYNYPNGTSVRSDGGNVKFGDDPANDNIKRLDFGLRAELGLEIKSFRLCVAYEHSLANNVPTGEDLFGIGHVLDGKLRYRTLNATLTYYWLHQ